jgi:hypothetical protein
MDLIYNINLLIKNYILIFFDNMFFFLILKLFELKRNILCLLQFY